MSVFEPAFLGLVAGASVGSALLFSLVVWACCIRPGHRLVAEPVRRFEELRAAGGSDDPGEMLVAGESSRVELQQAIRLGRDLPEAVLMLATNALCIVHFDVFSKAPFGYNLPYFGALLLVELVSPRVALCGAGVLADAIGVLCFALINVVFVAITTRMSQVFVEASAPTASALNLLALSAGVTVGANVALLVFAVASLRWPVVARATRARIKAEADELRRSKTHVESWSQFSLRANHRFLAFYDVYMVFGLILLELTAVPLVVNHWVFKLTGLVLAYSLEIYSLRFGHKYYTTFVCFCCGMSVVFALYVGAALYSLLVELTLLDGGLDLAAFANIGGGGGGGSFTVGTNDLRTLTTGSLIGFLSMQALCIPVLACCFVSCYCCSRALRLKKEVSLGVADTRVMKAVASVETAVGPKIAKVVAGSKPAESVSTDPSVAAADTVADAIPALPPPEESRIGLQHEPQPVIDNKKDD